jgi:hypothetical protein
MFTSTRGVALRSVFIDGQSVNVNAVSVYRRQTLYGFGCNIAENKRLSLAFDFLDRHDRTSSFTGISTGTSFSRLVLLFAAL